MELDLQPIKLEGVSEERPLIIACLLYTSDAADE